MSECITDTSWGTPVEVERRRRIKLAVAAYAYEFMSESIISDSEFDDMSKLVDPSIKTGDRTMDSFFKNKFNADTGQWIQSYPKTRLAGIVNIYKKYYEKK